MVKEQLRGLATGPCCHGFAAIRARGRAAIVANVSRTVVAEARETFPPVAAVAISAAPATLAARLAGRGSEDAAEG